MCVHVSVRAHRNQLAPSLFSSVPLVLCSGCLQTHSPGNLWLPLTPSPLPLVNSLPSSSHPHWAHSATLFQICGHPDTHRGAFLPAALCLLQVSSRLLCFGLHPVLALLRNLLGLVTLPPHFPFTPSLLKGILPTGSVSACFHISRPQNRALLPSTFRSPSVSSLSSPETSQRCRDSWALFPTPHM